MVRKSNQVGNFVKPTTAGEVGVGSPATIMKDSIVLHESPLKVKNEMKFEEPTRKTNSGNVLAIIDLATNTNLRNTASSKVVQLVKN